MKKSIRRHDSGALLTVAILAASSLCGLCGSAQGDSDPLCSAPEIFDLDGSGMVAPADLLTLIDGMNGPDPQAPHFDIDGSGDVNELDIDALVAGIAACRSVQAATVADDRSNLRAQASVPQVMVTLTPTTPGPYAPGQQVTIVVSLQRAQAAGQLRARLIQFDVVLSYVSLGVTYPVTHPLATNGPITFWDFSSTSICASDPTSCGDNHFLDPSVFQPPDPIVVIVYIGLTQSPSRQITVPFDATPIPVGLVQVTMPSLSGVYRLDMMNAENVDVNFGAEFRGGFGSVADPSYHYRASTGEFAGGILDMVVDENVQCVSGTPCESDGIECTDDLCVNGQCTHSPSSAGSACGDQNPQGPCDLADVCDGAGSCLSNIVAAATACRPAIGECDLTEQCDGQSPECPADIVIASQTPCADDGQECTSDICQEGVCRHDPLAFGSPCGSVSPLGSCDAPDSCNDTGICLANLAPGGTPCRPAIDECDVSEFCTGLAPGCPADSFAPGGAPCADDGNECTEDACNGAGQCNHAEVAGCRDIPTVSTWGLLILSLLLAVGAKLRFRIGLE